MIGTRTRNLLPKKFATNSNWQIWFANFCCCHNIQNAITTQLASWSLNSTNRFFVCGCLTMSLSLWYVIGAYHSTLETRFKKLSFDSSTKPKAYADHQRQLVILQDLKLKIRSEDRGTPEEFCEKLHTVSQLYFWLLMESDYWAGANQQIRTECVSKNNYCFVCLLCMNKKNNFGWPF